MTLYYNQFCLSTHLPIGYNSWHQLKLLDKYYLITHPNLKVFKANTDNISAFLIGYMLDPQDPRASSEIILNRLVDDILIGKSLFDAIEILGGRWALVFNDGLSTKLLHDASGLRQVFYYYDEKMCDFYCSSQPDHIARFFDLEMDPEAINFIHWFMAKEKEYWWPGDSSPYREIKRLLPNHYLDLEKKETIRFWPNKQREHKKIGEMIPRLSKTLSGMVESAANAFDLTLGTSSGWDSRLMLAASKSVTDQIRFYTVKKTDLDPKHPDIEIPIKLQKKFGLNHDLVEPLSEVSTAFTKTFKQQIPFAHLVRLTHMFTNLQYYQRKKVAATGNVSEVARCCYERPENYEQEIAPEYLMKVTRANHPFAHKHYQQWLSSIINDFDYNILDLFYWEQRIGSWFAQNCLEFDTAWLDIFIPFNSRKLLLDMLAVDEQYRGKSSCELYRRLIMKLWPEVLCYPINPPLKPKGLINNLKRGYRLINRHLF